MLERARAHNGGKLSEQYQGELKKLSYHANADIAQNAELQNGFSIQDAERYALLEQAQRYNANKGGLSANYQTEFDELSHRKKAYDISAADGSFAYGTPTDADRRKLATSINGKNVGVPGAQAAYDYLRGAQNQLLENSDYTKQDES
ncbi:MAG: hypothetical protein RSA97_02990, partial [Oscillospiraceae bacterium]